MPYLNNDATIGWKWLSDADLGGGHQTHIGLLEGIFNSDDYHNVVMHDIPTYICGLVGLGTMCMDFIEEPNGDLRSPKIRSGSTTDERHSNIVKVIRSLYSLFPESRWVLLFSINRYKRPFFVFLKEGSTGWNKAYEMGIVFDRNNEIISTDHACYNVVSSFIDWLFDGKNHDNPPSPQTSGNSLGDVRSKSWNRIVFGAPGTGKSYLLNKDANAFIEGVTLSEEELLKEEILQADSSIEKNFAIGLKHSKVFKDKDRKAIQEQFNCSDNAAYAILQGLKSSELLQELPNCDEDTFDDSFFKSSYENLINQNKGKKQACAALVGYKYADYLIGKTINDLADMLGVKNTSSIGNWAMYGVKAASYKFEAIKDKVFKRFERVTFHPDYSYAQFVGTYKPVKLQQDDGAISYEYVPGPFVRVLVNAIKNPDKKFLLLIEEINRANVAAVFGAVFQLLDRDDEGSSLYPIEVSEDLKNYLSSVGIKSTSIAIPSNMYIWATMNSADQGVFPMDTAFKRRWDFEYIGINSNEKDMKDAMVILGEGEYEHKIKWNELRRAINDYLSNDLKINEDKQLGPYFIGRKIVVPTNGAEIDSEVFKAAFKNKVIMYLFDDAAKQKRASLFAGVEKNSNRYSEICDEFDSKGMRIFNSKICDSVNIIKDSEPNS